MSVNEILVWCCGIYSLAFAFFHCTFWVLFKWKTELNKLSVVNRAIMQILNLRLTYILLLVAFLCFFFTDDLLQTKLGRVLLTGMAIFWLGRTIEQFIFLRIRNRIVNMLTVAFIIGTVLFALPLVL